jgi:CDP-glucose 4,6-dehydratase
LAPIKDDIQNLYSAACVGRSSKIGADLMAFWAGRRVLITGHTGFKGAWLAHWLLQCGAKVYGLALAPDTRPSLFDQLDLERRMDHALGDIRDAAVVAHRIDAVAPEVVFHLAAQPLVRRSYSEPAETFSTNVMGTVHVMEALRQARAKVALVVITTDKVYENHEWVHAYRETDRLGGHDPYSASKAACELAVASYRKSFWADGPVGVAVARAGNVIGGGDWAEGRIVPDFIRAGLAGEPLGLRNPQALRPWQHVLDPLAGYMTLAERLYASDAEAADAFNFGPDSGDQRRVCGLLEAARTYWPLDWRDASNPSAPHEAGLLALTTDKARQVLGWRPRWGLDAAIARTIGWYRAVHLDGADPVARTNADIAAFEAGVP